MIRDYIPTHVQPLNLLTSIPEDVFFPCVTGHSTYPFDRTSIKIFIEEGINLRSSCKDLCKKVDQCWRSCLEVFWNDWRECMDLPLSTRTYFVHQMPDTFRFVFNWIEGKPKICHHTLQELLANDFSLKFKPEDEKGVQELKRCLLPIYWASHLGIKAYARGDGDLAFIDMENRQFIEELKSKDDAQPVFSENIKPIFYDNGVFVLYYNERTKTRELRFYTIEANDLLLKKALFICSEVIYSMHLLDDFIIFMLSEKMVVLSIADLQNLDSPSLIFSEIKGALSLKSINGGLLLFREDLKKQLRIQRLYLEDRVLKSNNCVLEGATLFKNIFFNCTHIFHEESQHDIFLLQETKHHFRLALIASDNSIQIYSIPIRDTCRLIAFKKTALLCSKSWTNHLQIQRVDVVKGHIVINTLDVQGVKDIQFNKLVSAYAYLDKLYILGLFDMNKRHIGENAQYYLVVIDMIRNLVQNIQPLGTGSFDCSCMISSGHGKLHISIPRIISPCILKVDYT
jgi:hypothetical protein